MRRWIDAIVGMKPAEKNQLTVIAIAVTIALFVPLVFLRSAADLRFANSMVDRAAYRMQRSHVDVHPPPVSASTIERDIARIRDEISSNRAALAQFRTRFAPVSDDEQQVIKLEISQLAQDDEVVVDSLVFDPPERNPQFGRPIISLQAHGSFQAAQALLRGLPRLSRSVTVVRFSMEAATPKSDTGKNNPPPDAIGVRLDLQLAM
jgi:hypothetical protein